MEGFKCLKISLVFDVYVKENKKLIKTQKIILFFSDFEDTTIFFKCNTANVS